MDKTRERLATVIWEARHSEKFAHLPEYPYTRKEGEDFAYPIAEAVIALLEKNGIDISALE